MVNGWVKVLKKTSFKNMFKKYFKKFPTSYSKTRWGSKQEVVGEIFVSRGQLIAIFTDLLRDGHCKTVSKNILDIMHDPEKGWVS